MNRMPNQITEITVYWDSSDPYNEGWAERVTYEDGHQESGEATHDVTDTCDLQTSVVATAYAFGLDIESDSVAIHSLHAIWTRNVQ